MRAFRYNPNLGQGREGTPPTPPQPHPSLAGASLRGGYVPCPLHPGRAGGQTKHTQTHAPRTLDPHTRQGPSTRRRMADADANDTRTLQSPKTLNFPKRSPPCKLPNFQTWPLGLVWPLGRASGARLPTPALPPRGAVGYVWPLRHTRERLRRSPR